MPDPAVLSVDIGGTDDVQKKFDAMVAGMAASVDQLNAALATVTEGMGTLGETIDKLGQSSDEASGHIHEMGEAGSAASASFKLLKTSVGGAVEVLTGGGLQAGVRAVKELGEGVEKVAGHFGKIGEAVGAGAARFTVFAAAIGATGAALLELSNHAAHAIVDTINLAGVMNTTVAQVVALQRRFVELGLSEEQATAVIRTVATRIEESWADIQKEVRDASEHIIQDQIAVREAGRNVAEAQETAATAQSDAERAHAEAVVNASEAVIHAKEAEFDAQHKVADAQRAYGDAVVNANEAQMNYADAQKEYQYSGEDAWRNMKDAIDAVSDAERNAADAATAVQEALLSIDEAATSVKGAYVSLYAAQLQYREATGGGRITRAERRELRAEQAGVALETAEERARGAEFQYARTRRDAIPEAEERQARAERGVGAAREAEDKAQQRYSESATRAADKLEKSGSEAAAALERLAKAGLELQLAPQKAADETREAQLRVEDALRAVRKTQFDATMAAAKAEDALKTARIAETDVVNKQTEDFSNNIQTLMQAARTGVLPAGAERGLIRPESVARAAIELGGGDTLRTLQAAQDIAKQLNLTTTQIYGLLHELGVQRGAETTELVNAMRRPDALHPEWGRPIVEAPKDVDIKRAADIEAGEKGARELITAEREAAEALQSAAIKWGNLITPQITEFLKQDTWKQAGEVFGLAAAGTLATAGTAIFGAVKAVQAVWGALKGAGGGAAEPVRPAPVEAPTVGRDPATGRFTSLKKPAGETTAPTDTAGFFENLRTSIVSAASTAFTAAASLLYGEASGAAGIKKIQEQAAAERGEKPLTKADLADMMREARTAAGLAPEAPKAPPAPETKPPGAPETPKPGEAQKPPTLTQVTIVGQADPIPVDVKSMPADFRPPEAHGEAPAPPVRDDGAGRKGDDAAGHLDTAASKLNDLAAKLGGADKPAADVAGVLAKIQQTVEDLVKATKPGQGQQAAGLTDRQQSEQAQANRELIESQVLVNHEQVELIRDQEELTKAQTELTQAQTELAQAQAETARQAVLALRGGFEPPKGGYVRGGGGASGGLIFGAGGPTDDNIPIMASAGEYVVNAKQTSKHRSLLDMINSGDGIHFQFGGLVPTIGLPPGGGFGVPSTGMIQAGLTSNVGMGGGYMAAKMMNQNAQTYEVDLRTDHGVFTVLATDDQMATLQQSSISSKIASTGVKPSWWS